MISPKASKIFALAACLLIAPLISILSPPHLYAMNGATTAKNALLLSDTWMVDYTSCVSPPSNTASALSVSEKPTAERLKSMASRLPPLIDKDGEVRELTKEDFANAMPCTRLPEPLRNNLSTRKRGPQKAPTKQLISVRFSTEVIERFRASGQGWQTRMDLALQDWLETHDPHKISTH